MVLSLKLLGEFAVRDETGKAFSLPTRKTRALLAYLAVNANKPQQRERLIGLLWGDRGEKQARHSLNQALMSIRRLGNATGVTLLEGDSERVTLLGEALASDLALFRDNLTNDPEGAAAFYEGPFLDGIKIPEPTFQDWVTTTREEIHEQVCDALDEAADNAIKNRQGEIAIGALRRLLVLDPLREDAHRRLIQVLYLGGDRTGALRQYQSCCEILKRELGVEPDPVTKTIFETISNGTTPIEPTKFEPTPTPQPKIPLSLSEKASIAVLPFLNMSDNREFEYLADGFTEDLTMLLARIPGFFVISRNSTFVFKGAEPDTRKVAHELGVRYVVQGSIRPLGSRLRITAHLLEAPTGAHIWSNRFDRPVQAIYEVQDEVVTGVMAELEPELTRAEFETAQRRTPSDMDAWACYQKAHGLLSIKGWRRETFDEAAGLLSQAINLDPGFALAHAYLALIRTVGHRFGLYFGENSDEDSVIFEIETAISLDNQSSTVLGFAGCALCDLGHSVRGIGILERAVETNPSNAQAWVALGVGLIGQGKVRRGVEMLQHGMRISPLDSRAAYWGTNLANALFRLGRIDEALEEAMRACRRDENQYMARIVLAIILQRLGRDREAAQAVQEAFRINEDLKLDQIKALIGRRGVQILENSGLLSQ